MNEERGYLTKWLKYSCFLAIIAAGAFFMYRNAVATDKALRAAILSRAAIISFGIDEPFIEAIADDSFLKDDAAFAALKKDFTAIGDSQNDIRYINITVLRDGKIVFYIDSEPVRYSNPSKPLAARGEVYDDSPVGWKEALENGRPVAIGPYTDKWGTFVSALVPVKSKKDSRLVGVLDVDMLADDWKAKIYENLAAPFFLTLLSLFVAGAFFISVERNAARICSANRRLKYQQAVLELAQSDCPDASEAIKSVLAAAALCMNAGRVGFWRFNDDFSRIVCEWQYNHPAGVFEKGASLEAKDFPAYFDALHVGRSIAAADAFKDPRTCEFSKGYLDRYDIRSMLDTLIWLHGKKIGVLCIEITERPRRWDPDDVNFAVSMVDLISLRLETFERRQAQADLQSAKDFLETIINSVSDPMFVKDSALTYVLVNDGFCAFYGCDRSNIVGRRDADLFPPEVVEMINPVDRNILETGREFSGEEVVPGKDGPRIFIAKKTLFIDAAGNRFIVGLARDITERKKLETEVLKSSKLESLGTLAGGLAHDFNNVLMGIIGNITLAKNRVKEDARTTEILVRAEKVAHKARNLTEQLITFSHGGEPVKKLCAIGDLVKLSAQFALAGSHVELSFSQSGAPWAVEADEGQLTQVFTNIVLNAKQALGGAGKLSIAMQSVRLAADDVAGVPAGSYVAVSIMDNGPGIPPDNVAKIFDPYFTTRPEGNGLGLATSYSIVKNHGGTITVSSKPGVATIFTVYVPARPDAVLPVESVIESPASAPGLRILIMDDESDVLVPLCETLADRGYAVESAPDGVVAVQLHRKAVAAGRPFDVIVMDMIVRGGMNGLDAAKLILAADPRACIIVSSGYSDDPVLADPPKYGFAGVLAKPYTIDEIDTKVRDILKSHGSAHAS